MDEIVINSKSETRKIIFVFHGYGANKENLLPIGNAFADEIADAEIHVPDGMEQCDECFGRQWFAFEGDNPEKFAKRFEENASVLEAYVDEAVAKAGLTRKDVILSGFSQGGMLAIQLGLRMGVRAAIGFSCLLMDPTCRISSADMKIFMAHGSEDEVVPLHFAAASAEVLKKRGMDAVLRVSDGIAHGIDEGAKNASINFIKSLYPDGE